MDVMSEINKKTWWDCVKNDMQSLGLYQKDAQSRNKWRRSIKGQPATPGSPGKMAVKMECVCVCVCVSEININIYKADIILPYLFFVDL